MSKKQHKATNIANKQFKLKNHFAGKNLRTPENLLKSHFAIDKDTVIQVLAGDEKAAQYIGEMGRQGRLTQELMPKVAANIIDAIKGTEVYNTETSKILNQGMRSTTAINKAVDSVELESLKYRNTEEERKLSLSQGRTTEENRHKYALEYMAVKHTIDSNMQTVDAEYKVLEQSDRPALKQIDEEERVHSKLIGHLLDKGSKATPEYIRKHNYLGGDTSQNTQQQPSRGVFDSLGRIAKAAFGL